MAKEVTIKLTGLALCFLRDPNPNGANDVWNIAFLCDNNHPLTLTIDDHSAQSPQMPDPWRPARDIIVEVTGTTGNGADKGQVRRLLNMSSDRYAHGFRSQTRSNLDIRRVANPTTTLVWLRVPNAKMEVPTANREDTMIVRTQPDFGVPKRVKDRGKVVNLVFNVAGNFSLLRKQFPSGDPLPAPYDQPIPVVVDPNNGNDIKLTFNNECGGCTRNDFIDLYEFVEETAQRRRFMSWAEDAELEVVVLSTDPAEARNQRDRVEALRRNGWEIVPGTENGPEIELQRQKHKQAFDRHRTSAYGNCDPVGSDPPPGGP